MEPLKTKVTNALNEARMLVLGVQVLLGFQMRGVFEAGFARLPQTVRLVYGGGLTVLLISFGLLLLPASRHRIVEQGEDSLSFHQFVTRVLELALVPFAVALGVTLYTSSFRILGPVGALLLGGAATAIALVAWYGWKVVEPHHHDDDSGEVQQAQQDLHGMDKHKQQGDEGTTSLDEKINHVLTEVRVVLPGAQALLGFQFATILLESFERLPKSSQYVHLGSLVFVALSTVILMTPVAYHRIVEQGLNSEHFHRFAGRSLLLSMVVLALGITGDFFVVVSKIIDSRQLALIWALSMLVFLYGLWFGWTLYQRSRRGTAKRYGNA
ncbi:MAG: hypothetical protein NVS4B8_25670 [Herpetosiphon sp.]